MKTYFGIFQPVQNVCISDCDILENYKSFYNSIKHNESGQSCFALSAHRVAVLIPDLQEHLKNTELKSDTHQYTSCLKNFLTDEKAGISGVLDVLQSKFALKEALEDGGKD